MWIELVFMACLVSAPQQCEEKTLLFDAYNNSLMTCMVFGQAELARWQSEHPAWIVDRHKCRFSTGEKDV